MRVLRTGVVALLTIGLATPAFAGDLQQSIARAATQTQPAAAPAKSTSKKPLVWAGAALFVTGMAIGLNAFINNENGKFSEFGEANAVNKELGTVGLATALGGGALMFLGSRRSSAPSVTVGPGQLKVSKQVSW